MTDHQWNLIDDLLSEFNMCKESKGDDWFNIGPDTRQALQAMWDELDGRPENDSTLVTIEWLESVGFRRSQTLGDTVLEDPLCGVMLCDTWGMEWTICNGKAKLPTRGDVRWWAELLGVELTETD